MDRHCRGDAGFSQILPEPNLQTFLRRPVMCQKQGVRTEGCVMPALQPGLQVADCSLDALHFHELLARGGQLVDVRSPQDFQRSAVPGALNLPLEALYRDHDYLDKHDPVILCGNSIAMCQRAAFLLAGQGFSRIYHLCGK
jgi:phage shock protein E